MVTVIIRIYGGQVLCVTICLLSTHPCTSLQKKGGEEGREGRRREKKKRSHLVLCSYIVFPFIRDKTHMAYLFLAHTAALESTMGSHRAHMNLQERATCKLSVDYLDTWVRPNCEIQFNNRRGSFPSSPFLHPLESFNGDNESTASTQSRDHHFTSLSQKRNELVRVAQAQAIRQFHKPFRRLCTTNMPRKSSLR